MRALVLVTFVLAGCSSASAVAYGEQLFNDPAFAGSQFNVWSCATCHATRAGDTRILPGATLVNSVNRASFYGGKEARLIDAASFCYVYFMRGPRPLEPDEAHSKALYEYLASLGTAQSSTLPMTLVLATEEVARGDKARGAEVYQKACHSCHGDTKTGVGQNSVLASKLPNVADEYPALFPGIAPSLVFIEKIRHGQFFKVGGNMPFFSKESLSDEDVGALLTYLGQ